MSIGVRVSGAWKDVNAASVRVGGAWKTVSQAYVKVSGVWKELLVSGDPYWANVVAMLHFDGADASTTITDSSPAAHTFTAAGQAQIDTAQSKFGGSSLLLDGTTDTVVSAASADWNFGTGNFTVDTWVRFNSTGQQYLFDIGSNGAALIITPSSGAVGVYGPGSFVINAGAAAFSTGTWYHIALVRSGNAWTVYRDGVAYVSNASDSRSWGSSGTTLAVGRYGGASTPGLNGWLDAFRITKGVARWTSNFTPPVLLSEYTA